MSPRQKRLAWFFGLWASGVVAVAALSLALKLAMRWSGLAT